MSDPMPTVIKATSKCRTCAAPIGWVRTRHGNALPVDPTPDPAGNVAVHKNVHGVVVARVITHEMPAAGWETVYTPHFATCDPTPATLFDPPPAGNVAPLRPSRRPPRAYHP